MSTVIFDSTLPDASAALTPDGDYIVRKGKIFEIGDYADKGFSLTLEEAQNAVESFMPVNANLEHKKSILDGKLGGLLDMRMGDDGKTIFGSILEPKWLNDVAPAKQRKVSLEWDATKKHVVGIAHTLNPRIKDAVVFDAYAKFSSGEEIVPFEYESVAERDAIPSEDFGDPTNKLFPVRTQQECRQALNELAFADDPTAVKTRIVAIAERKGLKIPDNYWMQTRGVSKPLSEDSEISMYSSEEANTMSTQIEAAKPTLLESFKTALFGAKPEEVAEFEGALVQAKTGKTQRELDLEQEAADLKAQLAKFNQSEADKAREASAIAAVEFADKLVEDGRIVAKGNDQYERAVALFSLASEFDANKPELACFSEEFKAADFNATEAVTAIFSALPVHTKNDEQVGGLDTGAVALFEQATTTVTDPETGAIEKLNQDKADEIIARRNKAAGIPVPENK